MKSGMYGANDLSMEIPSLRRSLTNEMLDHFLMSPI